jgi:hypothetical protein
VRGVLGTLEDLDLGTNYRQYDTLNNLLTRDTSLLRLQRLTARFEWEKLLVASRAKLTGDFDSLSASPTPNLPTSKKGAFTATPIAKERV